MTKTTGKASKNENGKAHHAVDKGKRKNSKTKRGNTNSDGTKFSRQNEKNGAQTASKGKGKPNKQPNAPNKRGASGTKSGSATPKSKDKRVSFETNKSDGPRSRKTQKKPEKVKSVLKNGIKTKDDSSLNKNYKELLKKAQPILATLPKFMQGPTCEFALLMLTHRNAIQHKFNVVKKFDTRPEYIPASTRFKFILTYCNELRNDANQQSNAEDVDRGIQELQLLIREKTKNTVEGKSMY